MKKKEIENDEDYEKYYDERKGQKINDDYFGEDGRL